MNHVPVDIRLTGGFPRDGVRWHPQRLLGDIGGLFEAYEKWPGMRITLVDGRLITHGSGEHPKGSLEFTSRSRSSATPAWTSTSS